MNASTIAGKLRTFLVSSFGYRGFTADLGRDYPLLDNGVLDSMAVLELVAYLEQELNISVADDEVVPENFGSIARLTTYVAKKLG